MKSIITFLFLYGGLWIHAQVLDTTITTGLCSFDLKAGTELFQDTAGNGKALFFVQMLEDSMAARINLIDSIDTTQATGNFPAGGIDGFLTYFIQELMYQSDGDLLLIDSLSALPCGAEGYEYVLEADFFGAKAYQKGYVIYNGLWFIELSIAYKEDDIGLAEDYANLLFNSLHIY